MRLELKTRFQKWPTVSLRDDCNPYTVERVWTSNKLSSSSRLAASCSAVLHSEALSSVPKLLNTKHLKSQSSPLCSLWVAACNLCPREAEWFCLCFPRVHSWYLLTCVFLLRMHTVRPVRLASGWRIVSLELFCIFLSGLFWQTLPSAFSLSLSHIRLHFNNTFRVFRATCLWDEKALGLHKWSFKYFLYVFKIWG